MAESGLTRALERWRAELGAEAVRADDASRSRYGRTTLPNAASPLAVLLPANTSQVQAAVRIAGEQGISLHPISRGKNWGYGDACPPGPGQVILDLGRMNRIVEVNERLAYAVLEPGVTQGQLYAHLQQHHPNLWMDATGAGLEASVIGNIADRGFGHTPAGDHARNTAAQEVVLPDGRVITTGWGQLTGPRDVSLPTAGAPAALHAFPYGIGPSIDGLFTQSNLGIITRATVWLTPAPEAFCAFFVIADHGKSMGLAGMVDRLAELRMAGVLRSAVHLANDLRVIASFMEYPWERTGGVTPIAPSLRAELVRGLGLGAWNASGGIYGTRAQVAAIRAAIRKAMRGCRVIFVNDRFLHMARRWAHGLSGWSIGGRYQRRLRVLEPSYGLLKGVPTDVYLAGVRWSIRPGERTVGTSAEGVPLDPLDHDAGLIWLSPVLPALGEHADAVMRTLQPIFDKHRFDLQATLSLVTERALTCVTNISFDRRDAEQCQRAAACYEEALAALVKAGYPPYRATPSGAAKVIDPSSPYGATITAIKRALDPRGTLSPGRYGM